MDDHQLTPIAADRHVTRAENHLWSLSFHAQRLIIVAAYEDARLETFDSYRYSFEELP